MSAKTWQTKMSFTWRRRHFRAAAVSMIATRQSGTNPFMSVHVPMCGRFGAASSTASEYSQLLSPVKLCMRCWLHSVFRMRVMVGWGFFRVAYQCVSTSNKSVLLQLLSDFSCSGQLRCHFEQHQPCIKQSRLWRECKASFLAVGSHLLRVSPSGDDGRFNVELFQGCCFACKHLGW